MQVRHCALLPRLSVPGGAVTHAFPLRDTTIRSGEFLTKVSNHVDIGELATCRTLKAQVTVVDVFTSDGGQWHLSTHTEEVRP